MDVSSLYVHIPYCRKKCLYCDFFSGGAGIADWTKLVDALLCELRLRISELSPSSQSHKVTSIYFGGGTPSLMPATEFVRLAEGIRQEIGESAISSDCEITLEANPEDVDSEMISAWKESGVNRVSLGVQTMDDTLLYRIGRNHDSATSRKAIESLMPSFHNISCDLIFGLPGQSMDSLARDLEMLTSYPLRHISVYSLMYEEGTALTALRNSGRLTGVDEETSLRMFDMITRTLKEAGFWRYEISNYARPGFESRHNSGYWTGRRYLGIGPAAHSYDGLRIRRANPWDIKGYLRRFTGIFNIDNGSPLYNDELLSDKELMEEMIMLRLRTSEGLHTEEFSMKFGPAQRDALMKRCIPHLKNGHLESSDSNVIRLTDAGIMLADDVISSLLPD